MKKEDVEKEFLRLLKLLEVGNYDVQFLYKGVKGYDAESKDYSYSTEVKHPYRVIKLHIHKNGLELDEKDTTLYLLHEIMHVVLWKFTELAESRYTTEQQLDHEFEDVADNLSMMFNKLI